MKVYIHYEDTDNSCSDPDCCGGPSPRPAVRVFSSLKKAKIAGYGRDDLKEVVVDNDELVHINW